MAWSVYAAERHLLFCYQKKGKTALCWQSNDKVPLICQKHRGADMTCTSTNHPRIDATQDHYLYLILQVPYSPAVHDPDNHRVKVTQKLF
jgi:hypothetical protein